MSPRTRPLAASPLPPPFPRLAGETTTHKRARPKPPEFHALRAETELERTAREMFARWGEWRIAQPEETMRAKIAVEAAERAYESARERLLASERLAIAPDYESLRATVERLLRALVRANVDPREVAALLHGRLARDLEGNPILGLSTARWAHERKAPGVDVIDLADKTGRVLARLLHDEASPAPRWTGAAWSESDGGLVWKG